LLPFAHLVFAVKLDAVGAHVSGASGGLADLSHKLLGKVGLVLGALDLVTALDSQTAVRVNFGAFSQREEVGKGHLRHVNDALHVLLGGHLKVGNDRERGGRVRWGR